MRGVLAGLRKANKFESFQDAKGFETEISQLVDENKIEEVVVEVREHEILEERWYRDRDSGEIWRYCPPEFPDRGVWQRVR